MPARSSSSARSAAGVGVDTRVCVLHGAEPMLVRQHLDTLRAALESRHGAVDVVTFDGESASLAEVLDELRSLSLLSPFKIVVVDQADKFVLAHRAAMERYAQAPAADATLVLRAQRWHPGNLDKLIAKIGCVIRCDALSAAQARTWLIGRAKTQQQRVVSPRAAGLLVERLGVDLMRLDSELAKLAVTVDDGGTIDLSQVEALVGKASDEQAWAIQEAILSCVSAPETARKTGVEAVIAKARELVHDAGQPDVLVTYFVADLYRKLWLGVMMRRAGHSEQRVAERLKFWGPRRAAFARAVQRLDAPNAWRLFDRIVRADARTKSGLGTGVSNLESSLAMLADAF